MLVRAKKTALYRQGHDLIRLFPGEVVDLADPFSPSRGDLSDMIEPASKLEKKNTESTGNLNSTRVEVIMLKNATYADGKNVIKLEQGKAYTVPPDVAKQLRGKGKIR